MLLDGHLRRIVTNELALEMGRLARTLGQDYIPTARALLLQVSTEVSGPDLRTPKDAESFLVLIANIRYLEGAAPGVFDPAVASRITTLLAMTDRAFRKSIVAKPKWSETRLARRDLKRIFLKMPKAEAHALLLRARAVLESWRSGSLPFVPNSFAAAETAWLQVVEGMGVVQGAVQNLDFAALSLDEVEQTL